MYILAVDLNAKPPVRNSKVWNPSGLKFLELLVLTSKSQVHNVLHVTLLMGKVMFLTLWYIRTSNCQRALSLTSWTQISFQLCLLFWIMFGIGKFQIQLKNSHIGFKFSTKSSSKAQKMLTNCGKKPGIQNAKRQYTNMLWLHNRINTLATARDI
jgi:hypothetical protein